MRALAERKLVGEQSNYRADILYIKCEAFIRNNPTKYCENLLRHKTLRIYM